MGANALTHGAAAREKIQINGRIGSQMLPCIQPPTSLISLNWGRFFYDIVENYLFCFPDASSAKPLGWHQQLRQGHHCGVVVEGIWGSRPVCLFDDTVLRDALNPTVDCNGNDFEFDNLCKVKAGGRLNAPLQVAQPCRASTLRLYI
jgi:hypothetical protein